MESISSKRNNVITREGEKFRIFSISSHPGYLPLKEAATWAGVSPRTLRRWTTQGLPFFQSSCKGKVLIRPSDVDEFLTCKRVEKHDLNEMVDEVFGILVGGKK